MPRLVSVPGGLTSRPFSIAEGAAAGLSESRLRGHDLARPYRGVRQIGAIDDSVLSRCAAYARRMSPAQVFSHSTAAVLWGIPLPRRLQESTAVHVSAIDGTRPRLRGVIGHEVHSDSVQTGWRHALPVTDAVSTWLQLASILNFDQLVAAADHLILTPRRPCLDHARAHACVEDLVRRLTRFHGRGRVVAAASAMWMRERVESPKETMLRLALLRHGLPEPEANPSIFDSQGEFIAYGDLVSRERKVIVEYDGEQHREDAEQFYHDITRHDALLAAGWIHIRETKETPRCGRESTPIRTELALRRRGWSPAETSNSALPVASWRGK